jgi:integrase/recombinase XerD
MNSTDSFKLYLERELMLAATTVTQYVRNVQRFLTQEVTCTPDAARRFLRADNAERAPSRTLWNAQLAALRSYAGFLRSLDPSRDDFTADIARKRIQAPDREPLRFEEMMSLLKSFDGKSSFYRTRDRLIVLVLLHCGLRVTELVSINLDQVDLQGRSFLNIRRKRGKKFSAPLNDLLTEALEEYLEERALVAGSSACGALFMSNRCRRISSRTVQRMVTRQATKAGISRRVTPHLLRHSCATLLAAIGIALTTVQQYFGHSSVETTRRYTHPPSSERRRAADAIGKYWMQNCAS